MSIRVESLAGGKSHNGLPTYVKQIGSKKEAIRLHTIGEGNHCKCHNVTLIIFALLAIVGAATLIALSSGPTDFRYFAPGVALIFPAVALIIWVTGSVIQSMCTEQSLYEEWEEAKKPKIPYKDILANIRTDKVTDEDICRSMAAWKPKHQKAFIKFVSENVDYATYPNADPKILTAFRKFAGTHVEEPLSFEDEEFLQNWRFNEFIKILQKMGFEI